MSAVISRQTAASSSFTTRPASSEPRITDPASVNGLWKGGGYAYGANVSGRYSEKASYGGTAGIGSPRFATVADGGPMAVSVAGMRGKNPAPTTVLALNAGEILKRTGGNWPGEPVQMAAFLKANPDCILKNLKANPPEAVRIDGIPKGTQVTIVAGAEAMLEGKRPPPSMAMVTNLAQLPEAMQASLGGPVKSRPGPSGQLARHTDSFTASSSVRAAPRAPLPSAPPFPGANATDAQLVTFQREMDKYLAAQPQPASAPSSRANTAGTIEDRAAAALGALKEPEFPGEEATEQQLAEFQKKQGKYNRMYEMLSKIMANAHEMKKAIIGNLPR